MKKLLFYNDAAGFGGHEVMMLLIIREMLALGCNVHLFCSSTNRQLTTDAAGLVGLTVHTLPFNLNRFNFITNPLNLQKIGILRRMIRSIAPDFVIAVQGNIEMSSLVLPAARKENLPVVSYIALAQTMLELGASWATLRDAIDCYFLDIPDLFVITGASQKAYLGSRGVVDRRITLIPNVVSFASARLPERTTARAELGISQEAFWFGLVARVVINHKGHDYLVAAVKAYRERFPGIRFLIVGDGPDLAGLQLKVKSEKLSSFFTFLPWTDDLYKVYAAIDAVLMPSNHEGVPLVMIEAGLSGLPVVASNIDGMRDYLPAEWLFERGDLSGMADRMAYVAGNDQTDRCSRVKSEFEKIFLRTTIGEEFIRELEQVVQSAHSAF